MWTRETTSRAGGQRQVVYAVVLGIGDVERVGGIVVVEAVHVQVVVVQDGAHVLALLVGLVDLAAEREDNAGRVARDVSTVAASFERVVGLALARVGVVSVDAYVVALVPHFALVHVF